MKYLERGDKNIVFVVRKNYTRLTDPQRDAIRRHWEMATSLNKSLFNNGVYCCNGLIERGNLDYIEMNTTDYATYKWARDNKLSIPGAYAAGTGTYLYDPERDVYVFARRTNSVSFDANTVSVASGGVLGYDPTNKPKMQNFLEYVRDQARIETIEELKTTNLGEEEFLGLHLDEDLKLEFAFLARAQVQGIANDENRELIYVPRGKVTEFFTENQERMEQSTRKHLSHWSKKLDILTI